MNITYLLITVYCISVQIRNCTFSVFLKTGKFSFPQELLDLMEKLQIQPGNLCQFLPQDVVRDFPQMTHQDIFYNTVKVAPSSPPAWFVVRIIYLFTGTGTSGI